MAHNRYIFSLLIGFGLLPIIWSGSAVAESVAEGKSVFKENCALCHQEDGMGKAGVAPSITGKEFLAAASDDFMFTTIRDGREDTLMAAFGNKSDKILKDNQIRSVVSYLRTFSPSKGGAINRTDDYQAMGDERLGKQYFSAVCAGCHGSKGEGLNEGGSGTAIGGEGFLKVASDGYIRTIIKHGRSNTAMLGFQGPAGIANLTNREIDDIIKYLRSL